MGSKGQLPLDLSKSVGICDGAPSNVFKLSGFITKQRQPAMSMRKGMRINFSQ